MKNYYAPVFVVLFYLICGNASAQKNPNDRPVLLYPEAELFALDDKTKGRGQEVMELRDEFSKTYRYADGSYTKQSSDFPMHFKGKDGLWHTYDRAIRENGNGFYTISGTDYPTSMDATKGEVEMTLSKSGDRISFGTKTETRYNNPNAQNQYSLKSGSLNNLIFDREKNALLYKEFWPGVDRRIRFDLFEIETDYILNQKPTNLTANGHVLYTEYYRLPKGAKIVEGIGERGTIGFSGVLNVVGANGDILLTFNLPVCYDQSYLTKSETEPEKPILGEYVYEVINGELKLSVVVPTNWLLDEKRQYPVVIDPTASSYQGPYYSFERYSWGCNYNIAVSVPAGTVTGWYAQWQVTATGGGYMSEGYSQIGYNSNYQQTFQGSGYYGGTYNVNTPTYTNANGGWGGGNMNFWWRGYRSWGSYCCCNTNYQRRNYIYVYVNYNISTPDPTAASASTNTVCGSSQTVTLTASNPVGTVYWYTGGCGATFIGTGNSINVTPNTTTTYFCRNYSNGIFSTNCASTTVTVVAAPSAPTASNLTVNCGSTANLSASGSGTLTWYSNSNATGQLATGSSYTTPVMTNSTTYYVAANSSGCNSATTAVTVTVNALAAPTASNISIGCGATGTFTASGGGGTAYTWYSNSAGTSQVGTGASYTTPALSNNTTYYVGTSAGSATVQTVGFNDCYATGNWSVQHLNGGNGSVNVGGAPNSIQLTGPNGTGGNSYTLYQITVPATGTISWSWSVSHGDCGYDTYGYRINGTDYPLATCNASGSTSVNVTAGSTFAFYGRSHDGCCGTFTATISNFNKPCPGQACNSPLTPVTVSVNQATQPTVSNTSVNCGQTATVSASSNSPVTWYSNSNGTGTLGSGTSYTTAALGSTTTIYAQAGAGGCASQLVPLIITVNSASTPTASNVSVNCGQTATLTASANSPLYWYSNSNGTGLLGSGTSYTTGTVNATTTVYVQAGTGACASQIIPVTASPNVQQPTASNVTTNCGQTAALSANGANFYYWYSNVSGTTQVGTGSSYTTPALNSNTTYYVGGSSAAPQSLTQTYSITSTGQLVNMGSSCGTGSFYNGCNSGQSGFNWTDNLPAGTQITSVQIQLSLGVVCTSGPLQTYMNNNAGGTINPNYHCSCSGSNNGIFTLTYPANQYVVGGNNQFGINANNCFGLFNGNSALSGQFAQVTVTYASAACVSPLFPVVVSVNQATAPSATNQTIGCQATATFTATASSPVTWYSNSNGTGQVGTGNTYTTPALGTNATYYMQAGSGGCASQIIPVTATVTQAQAPTVTSITIPCQTTGTVTASSNSPMYWYTQGGTTAIGTGSSYTTPVLTGTTTYNVVAGTGGCASQAVPVTVTVTAATAPTANNATVNCGQTATLTATASSPVTWFSNANGTGQIGTGTSYTTGQIYSPTTYYMQAGSGACASQIVPVTAAPNIQQPTAANASTNCGQTAALTASGANFYYWYSNAAGTSQVGSGSSYTTPTLSNNTTYYVGGSATAPQTSTQVYSITSTGQLVNLNSSCGTGSYYNGCGSGQSGFDWTDNLPAGTQITSVQIQLSVGVVCTSGPLQTYMNNNAGSTINPNGHCSCSGTNNGIFTLTYPVNQYVVGGNNNFRINANSCFGLFNGNGALSGQFALVTVTYQLPACVSALVPVQVTVNPMTSPTVGGTTSLCSSTNTTLTASGSNGSYVWYSNSNGTGQIGTGATYTTPTLNSNTTYYVQASANGCSSTLVPVAITVNASPTAPTASNPTICSGQTTTITASANANWYTVPTGGQSIGQAQAYTTAALNNTVTYYMEGVNGPCVSPTRTAVTVTVNATPTSNSGASIVDASTCGKQSVNIGGNTLAGGQAGLWSVLSAANNAGNPGLFSLSGTSANCSFTGAYGGTYVLQWQVTNQSTGCAGVDTMVVTFHQPNDASIAGMITSGDLLWCGLTGTDWSTSTNWYQKQGTGYYVRMSGNVQPSITNEVFTVSMANGGMCIGNNNPALSVSSSAEDVYVGPGITWNLSNDSINIAQNLMNNGTIVASTGVVNFTNNTNSVISGSGSTQLFNMRINKSGGATVTLQQPVLVTNNLNMVQGNVYTTNTNLLTLGVSSTTPGSLTYNTGTVVGPLRRYFANSATSGTGGLFPVGTATYNRYADFSFGSGPGVNQFLTVEYKPGAPMQGGIALYNGLPLVATNSLIQNYSADGYWEVEPTSGNYTSPITTVPYGVTLFANNLTGMTTPQVCRIIKSAGSNNAGQHHVAWQACGTHTPINAQASPQSFLITSTGTQGFSWFNIGTPNSQALPVELLSFSGDCNEGQVTLSWQTATEHNSDYYEVEKSRDGMNWQVLTTVEAAGNSTQLLNYGTTDAHAMEGNNYYRLTQVDIDGTSKTYDVINVSCSGTSKGYFTAYPNPSTGTFQVILNDKQMVGTGQLRVKDTKGSELLNRTIEVKPGINMFSVTDLNLAPGVYYIQIVQGDRATEVLKEVIR